MTTPLRLLATMLMAASALSSGAASQDRPSFTTRSELIVLHVTVKDRQGHYVTGLSKDAFRVFEDGRPQVPSFFSSEDAPVTVGLLIDNSGSMQSNRDLVLAAAAAFVETSNPQDEVFALAFNERVRAALPPLMPFTNDATVLRDALARAITARGQTALYDAIVAGQEYLSMGRHERQVLVVVSDGGDNASRATFEEVLSRTESSNIVIHTVGLVDPIERDANPKRLDQLAKASGGVAFLPHDIRQVTNVVKSVALDIRSAYTIGYAPDTPAASSAAGFRPLRVVVQPPNNQSVVVRTRAGYLARSDDRGDANAR